MPAGTVGREHAAGIGVPLVAMVCHSADPLLLLTGVVPAVPGESITKRQRSAESTTARLLSEFAGFTGSRDP